MKARSYIKYSGILRFLDVLEKEISEIKWAKVVEFQLPINSADGNS
jgi:hypothetical protein